MIEKGAEEQLNTPIFDVTSVEDDAKSGPLPNNNNNNKKKNNVDHYMTCRLRRR